jgi:NAD(P)H-dependent FMN reductase
MIRVAVIYGSVRQARVGIRAARFVAAQCEAKGFVTALVDPLEYPLPLLDKRYSEYAKETAPPVLEKLAGVLREADAYILVTGEYNYGPPPALKNIIDHFTEEHSGKVVGIVSYSNGDFGGVRAAELWRIMLHNLNMVATPHTMPIPRIQEVFSEDGTLKEPKYLERIAKFLDELEWWTDAAKAKREKK